MMVKKVLSIRRYKAGYEIREEVVDGSVYGGEDFTMKRAYTSDGDYIGKSRWAYRLCKTRGIKPELRTLDSSVCSIGFCEKEQKWYGWSHRAMWGFGVGDRVKKGDCAYVPASSEELREELEDWYRDPKDITIIPGGVQIREEMFELVPADESFPNGALVSGERTGFTYHTIETGRGEWTARTLDDCRQMACDFAEGVG